jgi:hypothetical protein
LRRISSSEPTLEIVAMLVRSSPKIQRSRPKVCQIPRSNQRIGYARWGGLLPIAPHARRTPAPCQGRPEPTAASATPTGGLATKEDCPVSLAPVPPAIPEGLEAFVLRHVVPPPVAPMATQASQRRDAVSGPCPLLPRPWSEKSDEHRTTLRVICRESFTSE